MPSAIRPRADLFSWNLEPRRRRATYRIFRVSAATVKAAYIHSLLLSASFVLLCIPSFLTWSGTD
ncbi:uncharacterized protein B0T15DRAFT_493212 [Chaetomium strumarium]|uniref:Uncharacterized protein n=1 Tax=Chaetomium strumarium TaxID=1170767 RepID=A0AAJ0GS01_9PEZI|nr:hypothetical protein B0T15DRAFT_493212 [Chaetomium strumarium]